MEIKAATDMGRVRQNNEDYYWVGSQCLVVCDGMGGHLAGEVASQLAVQIIKDYPFKGKDSTTEVRLAIEEAQRQILKASEENKSFNGMGTTITLALSSPLPSGGIELTIGHVGDSRAYIFFDGILRQVTSDHSIVGELLRSGTITAAEARKHSKRHVLTQALGSKEVEIEILKENLSPGAFLLLCTDGLTDMVEDKQISQIFEKADSVTNVAQELVDLANRFGGPDNITVIVAKVQ